MEHYLRTNDMRCIKILLSFFAILYSSSSISAETVPESKIPVVEISEVFAVTDVETRRYTGRVTSISSVALVPRVSGELLEVGFHDGDQIKAGQMLYRIDPVQYKAAVKSAEATVIQCRAEHKYARGDLSRNRTLFKRTAVSRDVLENAERAEKVAYGKLMAAEAELVRANDDLRNTEITAPISGRIGVTAFTVGNYITPSSGTLAMLIQTDPVRVRFALSTRDMFSRFGAEEALKKYGKVRVRLPDNTEYEEEGKISLVDNAANGRTDTIQVYTEFANSEGKLVVGSTVTVTLSREWGGKTLPAVPPSAIQHDAEGAFVYTVTDDSHVQKRRIELGNLTGHAQTVISGISLHERVVSDGMHKITDGSLVECVEADASKQS